MYIHEQFIIACYEIGQSFTPPLTAVEVVSEMNHAGWEMLTQPEHFLKVRIQDLKRKDGFNTVA